MKLEGSKTEKTCRLLLRARPKHVLNINTMQAKLRKMDM